MGDEWIEARSSASDSTGITAAAGWRVAVLWFAWWTTRVPGSRPLTAARTASTMPTPQYPGAYG